MSRGLALLFAVIGTLLLAGISFAIALREPLLVVLFIVLSIGFMGFGFATKAKMRRKREASGKQ
ncbi:MULTISPECIES: DUF5325 family protein [Paenibacillus]|uniref:YlaF family protein n=2 Tax=Paenibacillus chitinolyticus TaxID=79263 RepID=A0A410X2S4_9BACL|nr:MULTISPECIES: DUF5325 family protein [Paenibacillus]EGL18430.1 hypothetical protein HMPREF9413_0282 [Paenibacillus sp. HGF7]EPD89700.1 hypothetical protein HMPREF1207_01549 [Paenibacillus sp. HGH0039]MBV6712121.1 YlaF family protein [Paenibacillus chitinolyticus]MCY9593846.1 YlaF family protein [Paenibacillus chitinolyticus]MCY9599351.1 YlaF family protein [Paenibacillus chitinolyticus]